jgi:hypothetical protein
VVKFFTPWTGWTWYVSGREPDRGRDWELFGKVVSLICQDGELAYFMLSELEEVRGPGGLRIERDLWWTPRALKNCA